MNFSNYTPS